MNQILNISLFRKGKKDIIIALIKSPKALYHQRLENNLDRLTQIRKGIPSL
ncbi:hypothetical protein [Cuneatibacter caecimuris]|uniref:hypothetical protein n=1 Tax=Cuneatibacter caecimuris TaxID=1796618 RepID=UPI001FB3CA5E|nr:hypothetical protein [Cuneatibacter caecimuris]